MRLYIYVHAPGQFHEMDSLAKVYTNEGVKHYIDMSYSINVDTLGMESTAPCRADTNSDFDNCLYDKAEAELLDNYGCLVPFLPPKPDTPVCASQDKEFNEEVKRQYTMIIKNEQRKHCGFPCLQMPVVFGTLFHDDDRRGDSFWGERSFIQIYLKSVVRSREAVLDFPAKTMLAEFAGYSGIIFGISLTDITTCISKIYHSVIISLNP